MDEQQRCVHCGVKLRLIPYALGPEWRHAPYPGNIRDSYLHCRRTVATPSSTADPVQLELDPD